MGGEPVDFLTDGERRSVEDNDLLRHIQAASSIAKIATELGLPQDWTTLGIQAVRRQAAGSRIVRELVLLSGRIGDASDSEQHDGLIAHNAVDNSTDNVLPTSFYTSDALGGNEIVADTDTNNWSGIEIADKSVDTTGVSADDFADYDEEPLMSDTREAKGSQDSAQFGGHKDALMALIRGGSEEMTDEELAIGIRKIVGLSQSSKSRLTAEEETVRVQTVLLSRNYTQASKLAGVNLQAWTPRFIQRIKNRLVELDQERTIIESVDQVKLKMGADIRKFTPRVEKYLADIFGDKLYDICHENDGAERLAIASTIMELLGQRYSHRSLPQTEATKRLTMFLGGASNKRIESECGMSAGTASNYFDYIKKRVIGLGVGGDLALSILQGRLDSLRASMERRNRQDLRYSVGLVRQETTSHLEQRSAIATRSGVGHLIYLIHEQSTWTDEAVCPQTDPEIFYPEKGGSTREAKKICNSCGVKEKCLAFALENEERFGVWGGKSERERRKLQREQLH